MAERGFWSNAESIRKTFRQAFTAAGLPYFHPHSFRTTLARLGGQCSAPIDILLKNSGTS